MIRKLKCTILLLINYKIIYCSGVAWPAPLHTAERGEEWQYDLALELAAIAAPQCCSFSFFSTSST
jgi:hypothetical protein